MIDYKLDIVYLVEANTNWIHPKGQNQIVNTVWNYWKRSNTIVLNKQSENDIINQEEHQ